MNKKNKYEAQSLIYYERLLDAWFTARMEHDKSLLLVSMGGIGLLVTLLTTVKLASIYYILLLVLSKLFLHKNCYHCATYLFFVNIAAFDFLA